MFAEGPRCFCTRWNSNTGTLRTKPHHMPSSAQGVAPFLPPCAPWCGRSPNRTLSSTSYFSVGDNLLIISKIIKLGLSKSKDLIHLSNCVPATCLPRRQGGTSPFCGMFSATSSLRVATTRVLRGDSHAYDLYPPMSNSRSRCAERERPPEGPAAAPDDYQVATGSVRQL